MDKNQELAVKMVEVLAKQAPTPEEKKLKALIRQALLADNPTAFIEEVDEAFRGCGKDCSDEQKDKMAKQEADRLMVAEVWVLGCLAYWGILER